MLTIVIDHYSDRSMKISQMYHHEQPSGVKHVGNAADTVQSYWKYGTPQTVRAKWETRF